MSEKNYTLVVNPGSASRKYALYDGLKKRADLKYEYVDGIVVGKLRFLDLEYDIKTESDLRLVVSDVFNVFKNYAIISSFEDIQSAGIRLVAPSNDFLSDRLVDDELLEKLKNIEEIAPLHIGVVLSEILEIKKHYSHLSIVAISDSAFHETKPKHATHYAIDTSLYDNYGIKRYGYHGISVSSIVDRLRSVDLLKSKVVVCHLGSGSSVTAVKNGHSIDNSMGYSPLEGLMMATRSGNIDISAALMIKNVLRLSDSELEEYLNKKSGLLGVSGSSNDIRQLVELEESGDDRATLALDILVYRITQTIGQMTAALGGIDTLVFTGTVGERSHIIRSRVLASLGFLGFKLDKKTNEATYEPTEIANIASKSSKAVYVISTDEIVQIAKKTRAFLAK